MKRSGSRTGNEAYTLLEVLVTVTVLALGLSLVMPSFFKSAVYMEEVQGRFQASTLAQDTLAQAEFEISRGGFKPDAATRHRRIGQEDYDYRLQTENLGAGLPLKEIRVTVTWRQNGQAHELTRKTLSYVP